MNPRGTARFRVAIGSTVGSYKIVDELGGGGMGMVYAAEHVLLGRRAAVKVLRPECCHVPEIVQRFFNEARATTAIRHPGIVEIFDFGYTEDGRAYIVMELLDGLSLADRLMRDRRLVPKVALSLARRIAVALAAAHDRGVIHRDLKPDNIFLIGDPEGGPIEQVKLLDFGIAKLAEEGNAAIHRTGTGILLGTPVYMSPEQCRGAGECDARSDLYSLGCTLFEMLIGRPPFLGAGSGEVIAAHLHLAPPELRDLDPSLPPQVCALVARLLAKRPDDRPSSAFAAAAQIERVLDAVAPGPRSAAMATVASSAEPAMPPVSGLSSAAGSALPAIAPRRRWSMLGVVLLASGAAVASLAVAWLQGERGGGGGGDRPPPDAGAPARVAAHAPTPLPTPLPAPRDAGVALDASVRTPDTMVARQPAPVPPPPPPPTRAIHRNHVGHRAIDAGADVTPDLGTPIPADVDTLVDDSRPRR